jgi:hypothetical protein
MNVIEIAAAVAPFAWPLVFLLVLLLTLRALAKDLQPMKEAVVSGLTKSASTNAVFYVTAGLLAALGSLGALREVADEQKWIYVSAAAKVLQPGIAAIVGLLKLGPSALNPTNGKTASPFPSSNQDTVKP